MKDIPSGSRKDKQLAASGRCEAVQYGKTKTSLNFGKEESTLMMSEEASLRASVIKIILFGMFKNVKNGDVNISLNLEYMIGVLIICF